MILMIDDFNIVVPVDSKEFKGSVLLIHLVVFNRVIAHYITYTAYLFWAFCW